MDHGFLSTVEPYIEQYGYVAVAGGILLEDFGLPAPGETLLIAGAIGAAAQKLNIYLLLPLAFAGAVVGDNIGFLIGHFGGHRLLVRYGRYIGITAERLHYVESYFERYGNWIIVFARFIVILRQFNGIVAGTLGMHWLHFLAFNALGATLWVGFWGILAYVLGKGIFVYLRELHHATPLLIAIGVIVALVGGGYLWWRYRKRAG